MQQSKKTNCWSACELTDSFMILVLYSCHFYLKMQRKKSCFGIRMRRKTKNSRHQSIRTIWYCFSPIAYSSTYRIKIAKKKFIQIQNDGPILLFVKQNRLEYSLPPFQNTNFANITSLWIWSFDGPADWIISNQIPTFHMKNSHFSPKYAFISSKNYSIQMTNDFL